MDMCNLVILSCLHPQHTVIVTIIYSEELSQYQVSDNTIAINLFGKDNKWNIIYLNKISEDTCGADGLIEFNPTGPDIVFDISSFPSSTLQQKFCHAK